MHRHGFICRLFQKELDKEFPLVSTILDIPALTEDEIFLRDFDKHIVLVPSVTKSHSYVLNGITIFYQDGCSSWGGLPF